MAYLVEHIHIRAIQLGPRLLQQHHVSIALGLQLPPLFGRLAVWPFRPPEPSGVVWVLVYVNNLAGNFLEHCAQIQINKL